MSNNCAVDIQSVSHSYGSRQALDGITFSVKHPEIFALLGPNGGGKSTLFRILSTQMKASAGRAYVMGHDVSRDSAQVRRHLGVVFQSPSIDVKLTTEENLLHQGHLYGLQGADLHHRIHTALEAMGIGNRAKDRTEKLSGGMKRRVEIAKALLHDPSVLLLDEPSTGLDPGARLEMWDYLTHARDQRSITSLITTHLMEEAEKADRVAIIHRGVLVACGTPSELKASIGGEVIELTTDHPEILRNQVRDLIGGSPLVMDSNTVRVETPPGVEAAGARLLLHLLESFPGSIRASRIGLPTLEDVFIHCTGERYTSVPSEMGKAA